MRKSFFLFIISLFTYSNSFSQEKLTSFVNPFIGTGGQGSVSPGALVPYGEIQITPSNARSGPAAMSRYDYGSDKIVALSNGSLGRKNFGSRLDISVMPLVGPLRGKDTIISAATFSHQRESAVPGYYWVELDNRIRVELTATNNVGYHRYTFPAGSEPTIRFDLAAPSNENHAHETFIQKENDSTLVGYRYIKGPIDTQKLYFAARTSKDILEFRLKGEMDIEAGDINIGLKSDKVGEDVASQLIFSPISIPETIELKVALSTNSSADALQNLEEIPHWNFNTVRAQANTDWENELAKIRITSSDERLKRVFYTALYNTTIAPQQLSSDRASKILPSIVIDSTRFRAFPPTTDRDLTRELLDSMFNDKPDGYLGDAGAGQMSVWAVWNILGFHEVNRSRGEIHIGSPMVERAVIDLSNGNLFEIEVLNNSPQNKYVKSLKLNGANYKKDYLLQTDLLKGGKLTVNMGSEPTMRRSEVQEDTSSSRKKDIFKSIGDFFNNLFK